MEIDESNDKNMENLMKHLYFLFNKKLNNVQLKFETLEISIPDLLLKDGFLVMVLVVSSIKSNISVKSQALDGFDLFLLKNANTLLDYELIDVKYNELFDFLSMINACLDEYMEENDNGASLNLEKMFFDYTSIIY